MLEFRYRGVDSKGKSATGIIQAANEKGAYTELETAGITPVSIWRADVASDNLKWWQRDIQLFTPKISLEHIAITAKAISILLKAGLPLQKALVTAIESSPQAMRAILVSVSEGISKGDKLITSFARFKDHLPDTFLTLIEVGEISNTLPQAFERAARHFEKRVENSQKIRGVLIYPALLVLFAVFLLGVLVFFLVPALEPIFESSGLELPGVLSILLATKIALANNYWVILATIVAMFVAIAHLKSTEVGARMLQNLILIVPVLGKRQILNDLSSFTHALSVMLESGLPFQKAVCAASNSFQLLKLRDLSNDALNIMQQGESFAQAFTQSPLVGKDIKQLIRLADQSNNWQLIMHETAIALDSQIEQTDRKLTNLITPFLTIFIGSVIGFLVISVISAILEINELAFQ